MPAPPRTPPASGSMQLLLTTSNPTSLTKFLARKIQKKGEAPTAAQQEEEEPEKGQPEAEQQRAEEAGMEKLLDHCARQRRSVSQRTATRTCAPTHTHTHTHRHRRLYIADCTSQVILRRSHIAHRKSHIAHRTSHITHRSYSAASACTYLHLPHYTTR